MIPALCCACGGGHIDIVRLLLDVCKSNLAANDNAALQRACENGHTEIVRLLLDLPLGVNPGANNSAALREACDACICDEDDEGDEHAVDVIRLLLDLPPERGVNPAHVIANDPHNLYSPKILKMLRDKIASMK